MPLEVEADVALQNRMVHQMIDARRVQLRPFQTRRACQIARWNRAVKNLFVAVEQYARIGKIRPFLQRFLRDDETRRNRADALDLRVGKAEGHQDLDLTHTIQPFHARYYIEKEMIPQSKRLAKFREPSQVCIISPATARATRTLYVLQNDARLENNPRPNDRDSSTPRTRARVLRTLA
jgi:hypothetical protein